MDEWSPLLLLYDPPDNVMHLGTQATVPDTAASGVTVYFDNLIVREIPPLNTEMVVLDVDRSFDEDMSG